MSRLDFLRRDTTARWGRRLILVTSAGVALGFLTAPAPFVHKLTLAMSGICAQRPGHSYLMGGTQLPLEARMTGIYLACAAVVLWAALSGRIRAGRLPDLRGVLLLTALMLPLAGDGLNAMAHDLELPHLYSPRNPVRLVTGLLAGGGLMTLILPAVNSVVWAEADQTPLVRGWGGPLLLALLGVALFALVVSEARFLLYPIAVASLLGVLAFFELLNVLVIASVKGGRNRRGRWRDHPALLSGAFLMAALELALLAGLRHLGETLSGVSLASG